MDIVISISVLGGLGLILGIIIGLCNKFLSIENNQLIDEVYDLLPKINCGMCGNPSCIKMAEDIVLKRALVSACKPCKNENRLLIEKKIEENK